MTLLKRLAAHLPDRWQSELKRIRFARQIARGNFETSEPEYLRLPELIEQGDWVIDVGANVGHYTKRFSELVGSDGRVIAFEPVPATFSLLATNVELFAHANVTLVNAAVSDKLGVVSMSLPQLDSGLTNYYQAYLNPEGDDGLNVLTLSVDSLRIEQRIALVKIDAEGHESFVLEGMRRLITKHRPVLIVETGSHEVLSKITALGYTSQRLRNSPNALLFPDEGRTFVTNTSG